MLLTFLLYRFTTFRGVEVDFDGCDSDRYARGGAEKRGFAFVLLDSDNSIDALRSHQIALSADTMISRNVHKLFLRENDFKFIVENNLGRVSFIEPQNKVFVHENVEHIIVIGKFDDVDILQFIDADIVSFDKKKIIIKVNNNIDYLTEKLAQIPEVESINPMPKGEYDNNFASGFSQKNDIEISYDKDLNQYWGSRYLNNKGITGKGEVVTLIDEIVDYYHGSFYDAANPIKFNEHLSEHRKFSFYHNIYNNQSELEKNFIYDSHGTHTCGTIAGNSYKTNSEISLFNGVAPDAKIAYAGDLYSIYSNDPSKLASLMQAESSYITSNSWTPDAPILTKTWGDVAAQNPDISFIFSAGNNGNNGQFSVGPIKNGKNILAIGSQSSIVEEVNVSYDVEFNGEKIAISKFIGKIMKMDSFKYNEILVKYNNVTAKNNAVYVDIIDLYDNENEIVSSLFMSYIKYGIKNIIVSSEEVNYNYLAEVIYEYPTIFLNINFYVTNNISLINRIMNKEIVFTKKINSIQKNLTINKSDYSSIGPGAHGLMKPEIIAPGENIYSAASSKLVEPGHGCDIEGHHDIVQKSGTSMSTPNAAGSAALIRQYFSNNHIKIDSNLVKSILVASASRPGRSKTPDNLIGHGLIDLSTVLPFSDSNFVAKYTNGFKVYDEQHYSAKINVNNNLSALRIVMSYIDNEFDFDSMLTLDFDLDLIVKSPSGKIYIGNHRNSKHEEHLSLIEKVIIYPDEIEIGEYSIHVFSSSVVSESTIFSLFVIGNLEHASLLEPLSFNLNNNCIKENVGFCENGILKCFNESIGQVCQTEIKILDSSSTTITDVISNNDFGYYKIDAKKYLNTTIQITKHSKTSKANIYISKNRTLNPNQADDILTMENETTISKNYNINELPVYITILNNDNNENKFTIDYKEYKQKATKGELAFSIILPLIFYFIAISFIIFITLKDKKQPKKEYTPSFLNANLFEGDF